MPADNPPETPPVHNSSHPKADHTGPSPRFSAETIHRVCELIGDDVARHLGIYELPDDLLISVVMPVFNEEATVREIVRRVQATGLPIEIILVDDCSTDGTPEILRELDEQDGIRVFWHERNKGKGGAVSTGFKHVRGDIVIIQDADLEYDPAEYVLLIQPIVEGVADVVYGSRFLTTGPQRVLYYWHSVGNRFLTFLSNIFTDLNLTDMETCYKVFRREVIDDIGPTLRQPRFGFDPEITAKAARRKYRFYERGISYFGRTYAEGKKIGWRDAITVFWCILRYWLKD